jgi:hypothetical protein
MPISLRASAPLLFPIFALLALAGCKPLAESSGPDLLPDSDFCPPLLLEAGPVSASDFIAVFDEEIRPVAGSFGLSPASARPKATAEGPRLLLDFQDPASAGRDYEVAGEVEDLKGNRTRFVLSFVGFNARPARLSCSEVQTGKNSSTKAPHRDYVEFFVDEAGDLGGIELFWTSTVKLMTWRFPACEVKAGDYVVVHLAPEGTAAELDETGTNLAASGGVDSSPGGRDFWTKAGGLPDETGALGLRTRPGGEFQGGLFYCPDDRTGPLPDGKLADFLALLLDGKAWQRAGSTTSWEDAFRWRPSASKSICRLQGSAGRKQADYYLSATGAESPGEANPAP